MVEKHVGKRNFWALVLEKAFFGFGISFAGPYTVLTALAAQLTTSEGPNYLALLSIISATSMIGPVIGGFIAQSISYLALFGLTALLVAAGAVVGLTLPDMRMHHG